jgi:hypothetical protein
VAKTCHNTCILISQCLQVFDRSVAHDPLIPLMKAVASNVASNSWYVLFVFIHLPFPIICLQYVTLCCLFRHIRETAQILTAVILVINWQMLSIEERKACRDVFNEGLLDNRPEVQNLGKIGMATYLIFKPVNELETLATAYTKNCNAYAEREKKKRKVDPNAADKPDKAYTTTIMMTACLILSFPYDLPGFTPALLTTFVRHVSTPALKDTGI